MANLANAIYITGGGGTPVISASAYGVINKTFNHYQDKIGTFYASIGGMRGAINEDIVDIFAYAMEAGKANTQNQLNQLKFPSAPVFSTSRHKPNEQDCERLMQVFIAHNIKYVFLNGGNDTMEKSIILKEFAKSKNYELNIIGIPKTIDNDLLVTHRCPGYMSFAKQVAINTMSLAQDLDAFTFQKNATTGALKEGANAQVLVFMGRDEGWGAAASVMGKLDDSYAPHIVLTKEGGFDTDRFLNKAQNIYDKHGKLFIVASEGVHDGSHYLGYELEAMSYRRGILFKTHFDAHKNTNVSDSRLGLFLKILLENKLKINTDLHNSLKVREEGPGYLNRNHLEIISAIDFQDAINVGEKAADLAFGQTSPIDGVMVTLTEKPGETSYTDLSNVADSNLGSKEMTQPISKLNTSTKKIMSDDGMMLNRDMYLDYVNDFIDLNGPNRREILHKDGYQLPMKNFNWKFIDKKLALYIKK